MSDKPDWAQIIAAQLWCLPQHSSKVMDCEFAQSIADALKTARADALEEVFNYHENEIKNIIEQLNRGIANSDGEIQMSLERLWHRQSASYIRALINKEVK